MRATQTLGCHLLTAETPFFNGELEAVTRLSVESIRMTEKWRKRDTMEQHSTGRLCRFCNMSLKQGQGCPQTQYILGSLVWQVYCPAKVLSLGYICVMLAAVIITVCSTGAPFNAGPLKSPQLSPALCRPLPLEW